MAKLIIEIDVDMSDFSLEEARQLVEASKEPDWVNCINIEIAGEHVDPRLAALGMAQSVSLGTEYFKIRLEE